MLVSTAKSLLIKLCMCAACCVWSCRSEDEQAADGAANGGEQQHMSAKDTAKAAQHAAAMEKFNNQIRQLDDMVSLFELCYKYVV
jgi:hypothetical protein